jgi:hypothetical protein
VAKPYGPACARSLRSNFHSRSNGFLKSLLASQNVEQIGIGVRQAMLLDNDTEVHRQDRKINWNFMGLPKRAGLVTANLDQRPTLPVPHPDAKAVRQPSTT